jgi:putative (di)nucleoside polyphosphate hydrolase
MLPYRPCVGIMLLNKQGEVFVAKRIDSTAEAWQMPQGGVDEGEDVEVAALRELEEEIGTNKVAIIAQSRDWLHYDLPTDLVPKLWGGKYRGQTQKWFVMRFLGQDSDINIETAHPEFSEWKWVARESLPDLIVPFKRDLYARLVEEFRHL